MSSITPFPSGPAKCCNVNSRLGRWIVTIIVFCSVSGVTFNACSGQLFPESGVSTYAIGQTRSPKLKFASDADSDAEGPFRKIPIETVSRARGPESAFSADAQAKVSTTGLGNSVAATAHVGSGYGFPEGNVEAFASGESSAFVFFDDVVFTSPTGSPTFDTSINFDLTNKIGAVWGVTSGSGSEASGEYKVNWYIKYYGETAFFAHGIGIIKFFSEPGSDLAITTRPDMFEGWDNTTRKFSVTTGLFRVRPNVPLALFMRAELYGGAYSASSPPGAWGGLASLSADFSTTFGLAQSGPIFNNVPDGYTVNSVQAQIVDNHLVPEPPAFLLYIVGAILLFARRCR